MIFYHTSLRSLHVVIRQWCCSLLHLFHWNREQKLHIVNACLFSYRRCTVDVCIGADLPSCGAHRLLQILLDRPSAGFGKSRFISSGFVHITFSKWQMCCLNNKITTTHCMKNGKTVSWFGMMPLILVWSTFGSQAESRLAPCQLTETWSRLTVMVH